MEKSLVVEGPGRPPHKETIALMKKMLKVIEKKPGIPNAELARQLKISSLRCSVLTRRLEARGFVKCETVGNRLTHSIQA